MDELCVTLLCPPAVEEKLLDLLLMLPNAVVFTSTPAAIHGLAVGTLGRTEQVLGRALGTQIQVVLPAADESALLEEIRRKFAGVGLRYWVTPVIEAGAIA